jgi:hypothetical protein
MYEHVKEEIYSLENNDYMGDLSEWGKNYLKELKELLSLAESDSFTNPTKDK